ncbi:SWF/SNF helicase family protein [Polaromonas sp. P1-6]|nr:SWF/SNF helicase family protein [Polaromonas sp. P1-6]
MACNSTFLLDHETDHGHKVDELMTLLDELLEDPSAKAVVFSQWLGTHELIVRRLGNGDGQRAWGHVLFSGNVPGDKRGALVEKFHDDPDCRLFLSTDAGGVGLNLQHAAAVVINMDLPWNPAVLEQRIGRVHRMGQSRGVQVVNFVGQGSIEEGMLSVLAFKKSLFAGVLDGGEHEVFLQGTRLSQFMKSVEQVAGAMGEDEADPAVESPAASGAGDMPPAPVDLSNMQVQRQDEISVAAETEATAEVATPRADTEPADPWAAILEAGAALLQGLASAPPRVAQCLARRLSRSNAIRSQARPACGYRCPSPLFCSGWPRHSSPG